MPTHVVVIVVGVFLMMDLIIVGALISAVMAPLKDLSEKYPPREPTEPQEARRYSSIRFGMMKLGRCVHISVDRGYLHLRPSALVRLMGGRGCSVSLHDVEVGAGEPSGLFEKGLEVRVGSERMWLPAWCVAALRNGV